MKPKPFRHYQNYPIEKIQVHLQNPTEGWLPREKLTKETKYNWQFLLQNIYPALPLSSLQTYCQ